MISSSYRRTEMLAAVATITMILSILLLRNSTYAIATDKSSFAGNSTESFSADAKLLAEGIEQLALGETHTCALTADGGVMCWGDNKWRQLGSSGTLYQVMPVGVVGLDRGVRAIVAGGGHTCALTESDRAKCWGMNDLGQLGDGTIEDRMVPADPVGVDIEIKAIVAGSAHTCVLTGTGGVKCWGNNMSGQLGNGATLDDPSGDLIFSTTAVDVVGLNGGVRAIAASSSNTCAILDSAS